MTPLAALEELGCVASRKQLMAMGVPSAALASALHAKQITRVRHGKYVAGDGEGLVTKAEAIGGVVSHLSAALHYEWTLKSVPVAPTMTLPRTSRSVSGFECHWRALSAAELDDRVTSRLDTVIACSRSYDYDVALCVADSALRERQVTQTQLIAAAQASPRSGRAKALRVARDADYRSANAFESCTRAIANCIPGLRVRPQAWIGRTARVDLLDKELGIVIECESFAHHGTKEALARDVKRYTQLARLGCVVVRFTWAEVMYAPDYVRQVLADVVAVRRLQAARMPI
jgi:very-short-patch-repair endonuclease